MHWNCLRYCIGFPPELGTASPTRKGILIQDEFPIWYDGGQWPIELKTGRFARNTPSGCASAGITPVSRFSWDGQNESVSDEIGPAIQKVRAFDLSSPLG